MNNIWFVHLEPVVLTAVEETSSTCLEDETTVLFPPEFPPATGGNVPIGVSWLQVGLDAVASDVLAPAWSQKPGQAKPKKAGPGQGPGQNFGLSWILAWPGVLESQSPWPGPALLKQHVFYGEYN